VVLATGWDHCPIRQTADNASACRSDRFLPARLTANAGALCSKTNQVKINNAKNN
jgi:hypothetical protein